MSPEPLCIRATHPDGFRYGHDHPWGIVEKVVWFLDRPCFKIEFSEGVIDYWPVYDESDPYEFQSWTQRTAQSGRKPEEGA